MKNASLYRRMFDVPAGMKGNRSGCTLAAWNYQAWVWVNSRFAGTRIGGNVAFNLRYHVVLRAGANELVVRAFDDTASGRQPNGQADA